MPQQEGRNKTLKPAGAAADNSREMTAVQITWDEFAAWEPEATWTAAEFELLTAELVEDLLTRRLRKLLARGYEPTAALRLAVRVDAPL